MLLKRIKVNFMLIIKNGAMCVAGIFSILSAVSIFVDWDSFGNPSPAMRLLILLAFAVLGFIAGGFIALLRKRKKWWSRGSGAIFTCYGDVFKIAQRKNKKIVVIPVNDTFETIVDDDLNETEPLVSKESLHGQWLGRMFAGGLTSGEISKWITAFLDVHKIEGVPTRKARGNAVSYPFGTIVPINSGATTFYLLVISKFNDSNNSESGKDVVAEAVNRLLSFYDKNGQGIDLYIPLLGTGMSRAGLNHQDSLITIKSSLFLGSQKVNGKISIVVFDGDKDKVSIF